MKRFFRLPFSRDRVRRDVETELNFHFEGRIEELMAGGMSRAEAEREAGRRFGDRALVEAEVEHIDVSAHKRRALRERLDDIDRDTRYAARGLARRPLYTLAIVVTLALGIGANTAIFSLVEAVLLRPVDVPAIGRLVVVHDDFPLMGLRSSGVSPLESVDLFARRDLFASGTAMVSEGAIATIAGEQTRVQGIKTLGDFFTVFPGRPLHGRLYGPEDSQVGRPPVVVLGYALWRQLGGDEAIVGKSLTLDDAPYEVVGIMPPTYAAPRNTAQYWRPFVMSGQWLDQKQTRATLVARFVGRMKDGMTIERLNTELRALAVRWAKQYYDMGGYTMLAKGFVEDQAGNLRPIVLALFGAVMFVLLIACANVASLQLVRAPGRAREIAVRTALGAGRAAIARQLVVESALLALAGGLAGIALGKAGLVWLTHLNLSQFPALKDLKLDGTVLAFTAGTVVLAGIVFGSAPALRAARVNMNDALRDSDRSASAGTSRHRLLRTSVIVQNALTLLLLVGAALTIRSLDRLVQTDPGFQPEHVTTFTISLPSQRYPTPESHLAFFRELNDRLKAIPGVQSTGLAAGVPFTGGAGSTPYKLASVPQQEGEPQRHANQAFVYGDFFKTMGIPIVRGRPFTEGDYSSGAAVAIVDDNLVRQSFGLRDPIGEEIEHGPKGTIVGVAKSVKLSDLAEVAHPLVYHNYSQTAWINTLTAVVRSPLPPDAMLRASRAVVRELDPGLVFLQPRALADRVAESLGPRRLATNVISGFAALSLILALLGIYAVMSYVVGERSKEIGIRVALGAQRAEIAWMVMRDGALLAGIGLAFGAGALVALAKLMQSLLYGVGVFDPVAIGTGVMLLAGITLVACWLPARRAVRVDPVVALRSE